MVKFHFDLSGIHFSEKYGYEHSSECVEKDIKTKMRSPSSLLSGPKIRKAHLNQISREGIEVTVWGILCMAGG